MFIALCISIILLIATAIGTSYVIVKLLRENERVETIIQDMHQHLDDLHTSAVDILSKDIYSDEPMVRVLVDLLKNLENYLKDIDDTLYFTDETPEPPKKMGGYFQNLEKK
jgi:archaellum component FlaF (FlaF/FlaG flagellin family)